MKKIVKIIIFLTIFYILFNIVFKILWIPRNPISYFYDEPRNSLDVVYVGSSNAYAHFNTTLAYDLYGYTTGLVSADAQHLIFAKYLIKESEKRQKPKLYVIDLSTAINDLSSTEDGYIRTTIDSMKFSKNRIDAINDVLSYKSDINKKDYINYYFSFLMYHNKWKNPSNTFFNKDLYKGYLYSDMTSKTEPQKEYNWTEKVSNLPNDNKKILLELIDYIKENDLKVLFIIPKRYFDEEISTKLNESVKIIEDNNLKVINCNKVEKLNNIDFETDLYNYGHLNVYGATKYTLWFSKYLKENYNLPNHKKDKKYSSWEDEYRRFKDSFNKTTNKNFDDLLLEYSKLF